MSGGEILVYSCIAGGNGPDAEVANEGASGAVPVRKESTPDDGGCGCDCVEPKAL